MTHQHFLKEQARLRAIIWNGDLPEETRMKAQGEMDKVLAEYQKSYPTITGTFYYTQEEVEEATKAGFLDT